MSRSKAAARLAAKCRPLEPEWPQRELADRLGVRPQAVAAWLSGDYKPKLAVMLELEKLTGIPLTEWTEPEDSDPKEHTGDIA